ncbi:MAG: hypothetical protein CVV27_07460 [Candidatus Melainabacteria bacterium HGW-Melainabacteria-1]|nr:MAG: hypothetical protein CVV27_07460 [Candidatus Melainabacteria bacterium HGW-Melainabacteria-1]
MAATTALKRAARLQPAQGMIGETRQVVLGVTTKTEQIPNIWILSVFGLLVCTFLVYFHTVLIENQANHKQQEIIRIKEENDMLVARLAELKTLPSVEARATRMGMQPVENFHYISVDSQVYQTAQSSAGVDVSTPRYPVQTPIGF